MLPIVVPICVEFASSRTWSQRRAAASLLARLAEGNSSSMQAHLPQCVKLLDALLKDPSQSVVFESIQTIGQYADLYRNTSQVISGFVQAFFPILLTYLKNDSKSVCDMVRGHACNALITFCNPNNAEGEALEADILLEIRTMLKPYLEDTLKTIVQCLQTANIEIKVKCLMLLSRIARISVSAFRPFYNDCNSFVKTIIDQTANNEDLLSCHGKAIECMGIMAESVGVDAVAPHASAVMDTLMKALQVNQEDFSVEYTLPACSRLSKVLAPHFEPLLPALMSGLFKLALIEIPASFDDVRDTDGNMGQTVYDEETGIARTVVLVEKGVKKCYVQNIESVRQKALATDLICAFITNMKGYLKSYLAPSLEAILQLISEQKSAKVRVAAGNAIPKLCDAYIDAQNKGFSRAQDTSQAFKLIFEKLLEALRDACDNESRMCFADALQLSLEACYLSGTLTADGRMESIVFKPELPISISITEVIFTKLIVESMKVRKEIESDVMQDKQKDNIEIQVA